MWKKLGAKALLLLKLCVDWLLLVLLAIQVLIAACLLSYGYIPLPSHLINATLLQQKLDGLYVQAESFRLKLGGELELRGLQVYHDKFNHPILQTAATFVEYRLHQQGVYGFHPTGLLVSGGTLEIPSIYTPDGKHATILEHITFHLTPTQDLIQIDSFAAQHEDIRLRGSINWPIQSKLKPTASDAGDQLDRFYKLIATGLKQKERFSPFIQPTLQFGLNVAQDNSVQFTVQLLCEQLQHPYGTGTDFHLQAAFKLEQGTLIPQSPLHVNARTLDLPTAKLSAETISAHIAVDQWIDILRGRWPTFNVSAYQLTIDQIELQSPQITISPKNFPELHFSGSTTGLNGGVAFSGSLNSHTKSGQLHAKGSVDLLRLFPQSALTKLPKFEFESMPYCDLTIDLNEHFQLDRTRFRIDVQDFHTNGLRFDHMLVKGSYHAGIFQLKQILIDRDTQWMNAIFSLNNRTHDFKLSLVGSAFPKQYSPLLPRWWDRIFQDIDFEPDMPGYGDFVIYGNTHVKRTTFFWGRVATDHASYKKVPIDYSECIVRGRGNYVELYDINAQSHAGWARGRIGFTHGSIPNQGLLSTRYTFDSLMPVAVAAKLFGDPIATIIDEFELIESPRVRLDGVNFNNAYPEYSGKNMLYVDASVQTPLRFKQIALDHLRFKLYGRASNIYLREVEFGYADGFGQAAIDLLDPSDTAHDLRFQLSLDQANQAKAIQNLPGADRLESGLDQAQLEANQQARSKGTVQLNLHARGPRNNPYQLQGHGHMNVTNKQLGAIQLFGPLSKILQNTRLNFTSFNLEHMSAAFAIEQEQLNITELIINGPRTRIWANGTFQIPDQTLDMAVSVSLFANMGKADSKMHTLRKLISYPIPNLLVFNLSGTVYDQKIRSYYDPRNLIPSF